MESEGIRYRINPTFIFRKIGQVNVLVNITNNKLYELNETAVKIFILLSQSYSVENIVYSICKEYEVETQVALSDVERLILIFKKIGLLNSTKNRIQDSISYVIPKRQLSYYVKNYWSKQEHPYKVSTFEITPQCNFSCLHCYQGTNRIKGRQLSTKELKLIFDKLANLDILQINIAGGEPFVREDFDDLYRYAKHKGFLIRIFTNCSLLKDSHIDLFKRFPPEKIIVTLYGAGEDTYKKTTKKIGMFDKVIHNINLLSISKICFSIKYMITKLTLSDFSRICDIASFYNVELRYAYYIFPSSTKDISICDYMIDVKDMLLLETNKQSLINERIAKLDTNCIKKRFSDNVVNGFPCNFPSNEFFIDYEGKIYACSAGMKQYGGNILLDSFMDIWQKFINLNNKTVSNNNCVNCDAYFFCANCPADQMSFYGDINSVNEKMCLFARAKYLYYRKHWSVVKIIEKLNL